MAAQGCQRGSAATLLAALLPRRAALRPRRAALPCGQPAADSGASSGDNSRSRTGRAQRALISSHNYEFLYTAVYTGSTQRIPHSQAGRYYTLLGHTLTRLLKTRAIPWKGTDAVAQEMRLTFSGTWTALRTPWV